MDSDNVEATSSKRLDLNTQFCVVVVVAIAAATALAAMSASLLESSVATTSQNTVQDTRQGDADESDAGSGAIEADGNASAQSSTDPRQSQDGAGSSDALTFDFDALDDPNLSGGAGELPLDFSEPETTCAT